MFKSALEKDEEIRPYSKNSKKLLHVNPQDHDALSFGWRMGNVLRQCESAVFKGVILLKKSLSKLAIPNWKKEVFEIKALIDKIPLLIRCKIPGLIILIDKNQYIS